MQDRIQHLLDRISNPETGIGSYEALARPQYKKLFTMNFNDGAPLLQVLIYLNSNSDLQFQANWKTYGNQDGHLKVRSLSRLKKNRYRIVWSKF